MNPPEQRSEKRSKPLRWYHMALLLAPFAGLLWPPFYAKATPEIFGLPFFYAYQFAWIVGSAALTGAVYLHTRSTR